MVGFSHCDQLARNLKPRVGRFFAPALLRKLSYPHSFYALASLADLINIITKVLSNSTYLASLIAFIISLSILAVNLHRFSVVDNFVEAAKDDLYREWGLPIACRYSESNILSVLFFSWINPLMRLGESRPLKMQDIPELPEEDRPELCAERFEDVKPKYKSLFWRLIALEWKSLICYILYGITAGIIQLASPALLYRIIGFFERPDAPVSEAFLYVTLLALANIIKPMLDGHGFQIGIRTGIRSKSAVMNEIYVKALHRRATSPKKDDVKDEAFTTGKIFTLLTSDAEQIQSTFMNLNDVIVNPIQVTLALAALLYFVGWPALVGVAVLLTTFPAMYSLSDWQSGVYGGLSSAKDKRTNIVNEMLQGIKVIKYFGWEQRFFDKLKIARDAELSRIVDIYKITALDTFIAMMYPVLVAFCTLFTITQIAGQPLDAKKAFTCLTLFNTLRYQLNDIPGNMQNLLQLRVALTRIEKFLNATNLERFEGKVVEEDDEAGFKEASFSWEDETIETLTTSVLSSETTPLLAPGSVMTPKPPTISDASNFALCNLTLTFPDGGLTVICGPTASGKSSLLQALLGEMTRRSGVSSLPIRDKRVAYAAQTSWLRNETIRDNILFGEHYVAEKYAKVIRACALEKDFEELENGDLTEIGEKGINLSGGQKQRVSLARALYSPATHILLDDPLSAVDAPTAKHIFQQGILGLGRTQGRTMILVTHATHLVLPFADQVVVLRNGKVVGSGDLKTVFDAASEDVVAALGGKVVVGSDVLDEVGEIKKGMDFANGRTKEDAGRLVEEETIETGSVKFSMYLHYFNAAGGWLFVLALIAAMVLVRVGSVGSSLWVREWTRNHTTSDLSSSFIPGNVVTDFAGNHTPAMLEKPHSPIYYSGIYAVISSGYVLCFLITICVFGYGSLRASKIYHDTLISRILYAPMRFFDTTPIGRILNRATKDISLIDKEVMNAIDQAFSIIVEAICIFAVVATITPLFVIAVIPVVCIQLVISKRYLNASRSLKRLESVTRSPVYSMFSETLSGVSTIRAFTAERRFALESMKRIETNNRALLYLWTSNRWLQARVTAVAAFVVFLAGTCLILNRSMLDPGLVAISLNWALDCSFVLILVIRNQTKLEMDMNAVERVNEYLNIEQESPAIIDSRRPPPNWPSEGSLKVSNLDMRYTPEGPKILEDISFTVTGGEKVGIVGRTGAGKSSLTLSLFRMVESSAGTITMDGIDIADIGLHDLRSRLTMIPQDPVLFAGTIRSNLDPFEEYSDDAVVACLEKVKFFDTVHVSGSTSVDAVVEDGTKGPRDASQVAGVISLDFVVGDGGSNFSQGQRQLLCLARALLKGSKIMVLDEATASVDKETDNKIQQAIRSKEFEKTTVISIAHRLRTVADYDKILVLDKGRVVQFGTPLELIESDGHLRRMCVESGDIKDLLELSKRKRGQ
ncbi:P-loop containing nucleoside triphosphate hydrolase protein [Chytridium lagenaria]|nr:P-loop containing nucleoside triphosphate hydrolase protein [Chytridium lagenaria]